MDTPHNDASNEDIVDMVNKGSDEEIIGQVRKRYQYMEDADHHNRLDAMEDLKFVNEPGYQWEENMKIERGKRPCYEFNKLRITCKRIINDIRANRPAGKVRAVEGGDVKTAEIYEGLIRNIWNTSNADHAVDAAAEFQVAGGMGAWRIDTEYSDDTAFEQDICIRGIENPFCLYADPGCKDPMKRDAEDWILTEKIAFKLFEKRYPKAQRVSFEDDDEFDDNEDWQDDQSLRICEYWYKEPIEKELWLMEDGTVVDSTTDEAAAMQQTPELMGAIVNTRVVMTNKIMSVICSGSEILEGPTEYAGSRFPFIMVHGEKVNIDGAPKWWGVVRFAKDAQRSYNVARTAISETISQTPKQKWWATATQAAGLTDQWSEAHKKNFPFMLYNADPQAPGAPQRMGPADVPVALIQESQIASEEIKAVTGIFDASMGQQGNETSGRAIYARQQQGEIATFNYQDNIANGVQLTYELLIDLIPNVYDTQRELRILGNDGSESYEEVNKVVYDPSTGQTLRINDLATGRYDVVVTVGPNFATQRQEAAEVYGQLGQQFPELMPVAGDLVFKSMDLPYAEEIAERLRTILPPQIQQMLDSDTEMPPEVQQAMQQANAAMEQVQQHGQLVQAAMAELEEEKVDVGKQKAELQGVMSDIKVAKADFDADVAKQMAALVTKQADIKVAEAGLSEKGVDLKQAAADLAINEVGRHVDAASALDNVSNLDGIMANFMQQVDAAVGAINEHGAALDVKADRRPVGGTVSRDGGKLTANVEFDDGTTKSVGAVRDQGQLRIVPGVENDGQETA